VLASFACTGLGMLIGAIGLRLRDVPILANLTMAVLLIFCGVNVPLDKLPHWMRLAAEGLPVTHAVAASRLVAGGASLASVRTPLLVEMTLGSAYLFVGFALLRWFEAQGRRHGTLDRA
jgi:ABC-type polysaccharide/polyol phosphate export permease